MYRILFHRFSSTDINNLKRAFCDQIEIIQCNRTFLHIFKKKIFNRFPFSICWQLRKIIINTVETERIRYLLRLFVNNGLPLLLVGPTGTGKSVIINSFLLEQPKEKYMICNINFSAQTSANQTQDIISSKLERCIHFFFNECRLNMTIISLIIFFLNSEWSLAKIGHSSKYIDFENRFASASIAKDHLEFRKKYT